MSGPESRSKSPDAEKNGKGIGETVAHHYNQLENAGIAVRNKSRIVTMRNFNNWIKSALISEAIDRLKPKDGWSRTEIILLDIGCGKGGDLKKYKIGRVSHVTCTDIAETSLNQCRDRYEEEKKRARNYIFSAEFIAADSTRDRLKDRFKEDRLFHLVSVQFVMHYSFESLAQAEQMIRNISENMSIGGLWIGTTTDGNELVARARRVNNRHFGNDVYSVTFENDDVLDPEKKLPLFGTKYDFHLDGCVDCPEFLLYFPVLVHIAERYGLKARLKRSFGDYYLGKYGRKDSLTLLRRMRGLERLEPHRSYGKDYEHAEESLRKGPVFTISQSEWEAITLYCVFAFEKIAPIDGEKY